MEFKTVSEEKYLTDVFLAEQDYYWGSPINTRRQLEAIVNTASTTLDNYWREHSPEIADLMASAPYNNFVLKTSTLEFEDLEEMKHVGMLYFHNMANALEWYKSNYAKVRVSQLELRKRMNIAAVLYRPSMKNREFKSKLPDINFSFLNPYQIVQALSLIPYPTHPVFRMLSTMPLGIAYLMELTHELIFMARFLDHSASKNGLDINRVDSYFDFEKYEDKLEPVMP